MVVLKVRSLKGVDKLIGLKGAKNAYPVYFKTRFGIHTFGVKFPIDVLILDENQIVVKIVKYLAPGRILLWNPRYEVVIELPTGEAKKRNIELGSKLSLIFDNG